MLLRTTLCAVMAVMLGSSLAHASDQSMRHYEAMKQQAAQEQQARTQEATRRAQEMARAEQAARDANWKRIQESWKAQGK